jgi:thioesterase domain-containing protein
MSLDLNYLRTLEQEEQYRYTLRKAKKAGLIPHLVTLGSFRHYLKMNKTQMHAWQEYSPRPYGGKIILFRSEEMAANASPGSDLGWGDLAAGGVDVIEVPGDHMSMMRPPQVKTLAYLIKASVEQADAGVSREVKLALEEK